jgi:hypothetical protein
MIRYVIVHCKHEGCYSRKCVDDIEINKRITSITVNPPKVFFFVDKEQANDFFVEYMNDVDVLDERCKKGEDQIEHLDCCTCGIIEMDDEGNTILFYNRTNQIFLLENSVDIFLPSEPLKKDVHNINLTNKFIRNHKTLTREQKEKYIELGRVCKKSMKKSKPATASKIVIEEDSEDDDDDSK